MNIKIKRFTKVFLSILILLSLICITMIYADDSDLNNNPNPAQEITQSLEKKDLQEKVNITGSKIWVLGPNIKPAIQLQLYRNGFAYGDPVELIDNESAYTWIGLEKVDSKGIDYIYTIDEVSTPENYDKVISEDGLTITNVFYQLSSDVIINEVENSVKDKTLKNHIKDNGFLYTMTIFLSSIGVFFFAKIKEKEF